MILSEINFNEQVTIESRLVTLRNVLNILQISYYVDQYDDLRRIVGGLSVQIPMNNVQFITTKRLEICVQRPLMMTCLYHKVAISLLHEMFKVRN